jgi:hypothetical protein
MHSKRDEQPATGCTHGLDLAPPSTEYLFSMPPSPPARAAVEVVSTSRPTLRLSFDDCAPFSRDRRTFLYRVAGYVEQLCRGTTWRVEVDADTATIAIAEADREPEQHRAHELLERVAKEVNAQRERA